MKDLNKTNLFEFSKDMQNPVRGILKIVCDAMVEKGYDPVNQLVGYIISGDPTFVTSHKNARAIIHRLDRDDIMEELVEFYIKSLES